MKVGSLVINIKEIPVIVPNVLWLPIPDSETIYTVRLLTSDNGRDCLALEEGIFGYNELGKEYVCPIEYFKEVQPPEAVSIDALMEEVNEKELFAV